MPAQTGGKSSTRAGGIRTTPTFLVTGVTGQQGGALARELVRRGHHVRGVTRNPTSQMAAALRGLGVDLREGDFDEPATIQEAAKGVQGAFIMATPYEKGVDAEIRQATAAIDAVGKAGVEHIVYSSVSDADRDTRIPHFDSKRRVEEHLERLDTPYTIVAPVYFRENLLSPWMLPGIQDGHLDIPMPSDRALQTIELPEIARFTADVLEAPDRFAGKRIDIASDETTPQEMADALSTHMGRPVRHNAIPVEEAKKQNADLGRMYEWFDEVGYSVDIPTLERDYPTVRWRSFQDWAADQDWSAHGGAQRPSRSDRPPTERGHVKPEATPASPS